MKTFKYNICIQPIRINIYDMDLQPNNKNKLI